LLPPNKEVKEMPERKWTREVIQIDTDCGAVAIPARVLGPIAVHFSVGLHAGRISITHLGTGRRIASTDAPDIARQVAEVLADANWDSVASDCIPEPLRIKVSQILKRFASLVTGEPSSPPGMVESPPAERRRLEARVPACGLGFGEDSRTR
jgi:hypothetical protein